MGNATGCLDSLIEQVGKDGWRLYSAQQALRLFDIVPTGSAVIIGSAPGGITVSGVLAEDESGELAFEAFDERRCEVLADAQLPAERCGFLPDGYAQAVVGSIGIEDALRSGDGIDLCAEAADMREASGAADAHSAQRGIDRHDGR